MASSRLVCCLGGNVIVSDVYLCCSISAYAMYSKLSEVNISHFPLHIFNIFIFDRKLYFLKYFTIQQINIMMKP